MRKHNLTEEERGRMLTDSRKLAALLEECRKRKTAVDRSRAKTLAGAHPKAASAQLRKLLEQAEIPADIIREFVPDRKEGLFGGLFSS